MINYQVIRPAGADDIPDICRLERLVFEPDLRWDDGEIAYQVGRGRIIVAHLDDRPVSDHIIGYAAHQISGMIGYLSNLAVLSEYRSLGIGSSLVRAVLSKMRTEQVAGVELDCDVELASFYERFGFVVCGFYLSGLWTPGSLPRRRLKMAMSLSVCP